MEAKLSKRPFYSERITITGTVTSEPVDVSTDPHMRKIMLKVTTRYVPYDYDPDKEKDNPEYYQHKRTVFVEGGLNHSLPVNVMDIRRGMFITVHGQVSGIHYEDENGKDVHEMVILAEEVGSNWRFNTWSSDAPRDNDRDTRERDGRPAPRRRRRPVDTEQKQVEEETTQEDDSSTSRRRRASAAVAASVRSGSSPRTRASLRTSPGEEPKVIVRGDDVEDDPFLEGDE